MKNEHSEAGIAEDLIRTITQLAVAETHAKTLYEKTMGEVERETLKPEDAQDKLLLVMDQINCLAQTRRKVMLYLFNQFKGDMAFWCEIKHLAIASYTLFEAYQASSNDVELLNLAYETQKEFTRALSAFLGMEITDCAACFSDMLKAQEVNDGN